MLYIIIPSSNAHADDSSFELIYGTNSGSIFYSQLFVKNIDESFEVEASFYEIIEISSKRKIYDIKVVNTQSKKGLLVLTERNLYQYWGRTDSTIPNLLLSNKSSSRGVRDKAIEDRYFHKNKRGEFHSTLKPALSVMEGLDDTTKSVGWQCKSGFYLIDIESFKK